MEKISNRFKRVLLFVSLIIVSWLSFDYVYDKHYEVSHRPLDGIVIEKYYTVGGSRRHPRTEFIFVIKDIDTQKCFDIVVTPTSFALFKKGDKIYFNEISKNVLNEYYNELYAWLGAISLLILIFSCFGFLYCIIDSIVNR